MYAIVRFIEEGDAPGIVCTHWISNNDSVSLYPNVRTNEARDKLLRRLATPDENWSSCRIRVLRKYSTFSQAALNLRQAEDTSALESEDGNISPRPRKITRPRFHYPGEESDEEFLPPPSQRQKVPYPVPPNVVQQSTKCISYPPPASTSSTFSQDDGSPRSRKITQPRFRHPGEESDEEFLPPPSQRQKVQYPVPPSVVQQSAPCISHTRPASTSKQDIMTGRLVTWMTDISEKVRKLENKLDLVLENQAKLLAPHNQVVQDNSILTYEAVGKLPVCDDGSFTELNSRLLKEKPLQNLLIKLLISVGGKGMKCHIYNMLKRVLDDDVAELYSLSGKSSSKHTQKKPFLETAFSRLIFSACQHVYKDAATEVKVKEVISDWLTQAKVRKIRRLQRSEKDVEKNVAMSSQC